MALPENFSPAEHLQDVILKIQNKIVRAEFNDVGDENWIRDISTPRASLRTACTHVESDSLLMTQMRNELFYLILRKAKDFHPNIYGIPSQDFQEIMRFWPQVQLFFEEKSSEVETTYDPLRSRISFRLIGQTLETFSKADAEVLAQRIKFLMNPASGAFFWKRGKELATYIDQTNGFYFQLYVFDETNAKKVIEQVLDIALKTPDWKLLNISKNDVETSTYPTNPPTKQIMGKAVRQPRKRPVGIVRFVYATCHIYGMTTPLVLYDPDSRYANALLR
jgi:hypothetical protein